MFVRKLFDLRLFEEQRRFFSLHIRRFFRKGYKNMANILHRIIHNHNRKTVQRKEEKITTNFLSRFAFQHRLVTMYGAF